jgi:hypothetical protein
MICSKMSERGMKAGISTLEMSLPTAAGAALAEMQPRGRRGARRAIDGRAAAMRGAACPCLPLNAALHLTAAALREQGFAVALARMVTPISAASMVTAAARVCIGTVSVKRDE